MRCFKKPGTFLFASVKVVAEATVVLFGHVEGKLVPPRRRSLRCSRTGTFVNRHVKIYMYRFVGHGASAIEKSQIDHDLSRRRPSSKNPPQLHVVFARCALPCSSLQLCRGRPRPCWRRLPAGVALHVFRSKYPNCLFVQTDK